MLLMQTQLGEMQSNAADLKDTIAQLELAQTEATQANVEADSQIAELQGQVKETNIQLAAAHDKAQTNADTISKLQNDLSSGSDAVSSRVAELEAELARKQEELDAQVMELSAFNSKWKELQASMAGTTQSADEKAQADAAIISRLQNDLANGSNALGSRVTELEAALKEKDEAIEAATKKAEELQSEVTRASGHVAELAAAVKEKDDAVVSLKEQIEKADADYNSLSTELHAQIQAGEEHLQAVLAKNTTDVEALNKANAELQDALDSSSVQLKEATAELSIFKEQTLEGDAAKEQAAAQASKVAELQELNSQKEAQLGGAKAKLDRAKEEATALEETTKVEIQKLQEKYDALVTEGEARISAKVGADHVSWLPRTKSCLDFFLNS